MSSSFLSSNCSFYCHMRIANVSRPPSSTNRRNRVPQTTSHLRSPGQSPRRARRPSTRRRPVPSRMRHLPPRRADQIAPPCETGLPAPREQALSGYQCPRGITGRQPGAGRPRASIRHRASIVGLAPRDSDEKAQDPKCAARWGQWIVADARVVARAGAGEQRVSGCAHL